MVQYILPSFLLTLVFTTLGRLFVYRGSMFDPAVAPGVGSLAAGDLLFFGAVLVGLLAGWVERKRGERSARILLYGALAVMFLLTVFFVPRPA